MQVSRLTVGPRAGWPKATLTRTRMMHLGGVAEGNPDADPNDALGSVRVHACVWELFMLF